MPTKALIPLPTVISPEVFTCYQFNLPLDSEWAGMFFGALDQLTRWNSYDRTPGFPLGVAVANVWKGIIADAREGICGDDCPGFYIEVNDINCPNQESLRTSRVVNDCGFCTSRERVHFSRSIIDTIAGVARIGYRCFDFSDDTPCGGHFCQVRAFQTGIGSPLWVLQWRDCGSVDHEIIQSGGDEFVYNDFEAIWICLSLNSNFCATVSIDGPVLCGVA